MNGIGNFCRACQVACNCRPHFPSESEEIARISTITGDARAQLASSFVSLAGQVSLAGLTFATNQDDPNVDYHVGADNVVLATTTALSDTKTEFGVILTGSVGPIPVQLQLRGRLDLPNKEIEIGLMLLKPIKTDEYVWRFGLDGLVDLGDNRYFAKSVTLKEDVAPFANLFGLDYWCVLRCGGTAILGILLRCLPSLAGGPAAYVACVTAQAGAGAAGIAVCIATKCT